MKATLRVLTLCLLGAVIMCQSSTSNPEVTETTASLAPEASTAVPIPTSTDPGTGSPVASTTGNPASSSTGTTAATSTGTTVTTTTAPTAAPTTPEPSSGLSPGAIAGITIGTIAGVGAIGGGIFAFMKYKR